MSPVSIALFCALVAVGGGLVAVFTRTSATGKQRPDTLAGGDGSGIEDGTNRGRQEGADSSSDGGGDGGD